MGNKNWTPITKCEIVLEVLKNEDTMSTICSQYQVSASQVHAWKKQFLDHGADIFDKSHDKKMKKKLDAHEQEKSKLYEAIGELKVERDFLKKTGRNTKAAEARINGYAAAYS